MCICIYPRRVLGRRAWCWYRVYECFFVVVYEDEVGVDLTLSPFVVLTRPFALVFFAPLIHVAMSGEISFVGWRERIRYEHYLMLMRTAQTPTNNASKSILLINTKPEVIAAEAWLRIA
jgi:hypothetical protein